MALASEHFRDDARLAAAAANNPPLVAGESGTAVARLQHALEGLSYELPVSTAKTGSPDGIFGNETKSVVRKFQSDEGLADDGIAGADTLARMDALLVERRIPFLPAEPSADLARFRIVGAPRPDLPPWVDWSPSAYRAAVRHQLAKKILLRSQVGRAVVGALARTISIRPAKQARDPAAYWQAGEGTLHYTPGVFMPGSKIYASSPRLVGYTADGVLLHELVHAMRTTQGFWGADQEPVNPIHYPPWAPEGDVRNNLYFGKRGEFNAIVIANTYLAEVTPGSIGAMARSRILLVKDHHLGHVHLSLTAPEYFHRHATVRHYLKMLWDDQPALCSAIARAPAEFNPIRDFRKPA